LLFKTRPTVIDRLGKPIWLYSQANALPCLATILKPHAVNLLDSKGIMNSKGAYY